MPYHQSSRFNCRRIDQRALGRHTYSEMSSETNTAPSVVTPGNHDGVHLGHRALVDAAKSHADSNALRTLAVCFNPHPTKILAPDRAPTLLTKMNRRVEILKGAGCDDVAVLPFDEAFAKTSPEEFVQQVLISTCNAKGVVVGPDFHFGHKRSGNIETLRKLGEQYGFFVKVVPPVKFNGDSVSSTRIRRVLGQDGDVATASKMMTRVHETQSEVILGDQRGRTIGFPTANLASKPTQLPKDGVYAVAARVVGEAGTKLLHGVANLGVRPTFDAGRSVEVHLFDFDGDLYGSELRVGFVERLRGEIRFDGLPELKAQIDHDCSAARDAMDVLDSRLLRWI